MKSDWRAKATYIQHGGGQIAVHRAGSHLVVREGELSAGPGTRIVVPRECVKELIFALLEQMETT